MGLAVKSDLRPSYLTSTGHSREAGRCDPALRFHRRQAHARLWRPEELRLPQASQTARRKSLRTRRDSRRRSPRASGACGLLSSRRGRLFPRHCVSRRGRARSSSELSLLREGLPLARTRQRDRRSRLIDAQAHSEMARTSGLFRFDRFVLPRGRGDRQEPVRQAGHLHLRLMPGEEALCGIRFRDGRKSWRLGRNPTNPHSDGRYEA